MHNVWEFERKCSFPEMSYHFTKGSVDDQVINDLKSLDRFEESAFNELLDIVFSFLTAPKDGNRFITQVSEFAAGHGVSVGALKNVMKSLLSFFKSALKRNLTPVQIKEDFDRIGKSMTNNFQSRGRADQEYCKEVGGEGGDTANFPVVHKKN